MYYYALMARLILAIFIICMGLGGVYQLKRKPHAETIPPLRIGYFANLTHIHALVFQALDRKNGEGLKKYLPKDIQLDWYRFNAGPSAMESLITGNLDVAYVGPSPAINLYVRNQGKDIRLLSGAVKGGSGLVLSKTSDIFTPQAHWNNKKIATPQYGNTQDIACRAWFAKQQIRTVFMLPIANADQLVLFKKKQIDGVWTIEPWLSRLLSDGGQLYYEDKKNWTTILVGSAQFCQNQHELKSKIIQAHRALTQWIETHRAEAIQLCASELKFQTNIDFSPILIEKALERLVLETEVKPDELQNWLDDAVQVQFIPQKMVRSLQDFYSEIVPQKD